jgi:hypothetical protein
MFTPSPRRDDRTRYDPPIFRLTDQALVKRRASARPVGSSANFIIAEICVSVTSATWQDALQAEQGHVIVLMLLALSDASLAVGNSLVLRLSGFLGKSGGRLPAR